LGKILAMAYRYATNTCIPAVWDHLAFLFAVKKVVVVLHGNELMPAMLSSHVLK
jgi:hypothetical protein